MIIASHMEPSKIKMRIPTYALHTDTEVENRIQETSFADGRTTLHVAYDGWELVWETKTDSQRGESYHIFKSI